MDKTLLLLWFSIAIGLGCDPQSSPIDDAKAPTDDPATKIAHRTLGNGYTITYPEGWFVERAGEPRDTLARPYAREHFEDEIGVSIERLPRETTLEQYVDAIGGDVQRRSAHFKQLSSNPITLDSGKIGRDRLYETDLGGPKRTVRSIAVIHQDVAYLVLASATPDRFDRLNAIFDDVVTSFKIIDHSTVAIGATPARTYGPYYSIQYPADWELPTQEAQHSAAVSNVEDENDTFLEFVHAEIDVYRESRTPKQVHSALLDQIRKVDGFRTVRSGPTTLNSGAQGYESVYRFRADEGDVQAKTVILTQSNVAARITGVALPHTFNRWERRFDDIVNSFRFE